MTPISPPNPGQPQAAGLRVRTIVTGVRMKFLGWAIALAAAGLTPAAAQAPTAAAPAAVEASAAPAAAAAATASRTGSCCGARRCRADTRHRHARWPQGHPGPGHRDRPARRQAFHDGPLLWMCALISLFVLGLLGYTMVKFRRGANPTPSRTSHNIALEVAWTLVPVLILVAIAVPSIRLLQPPIFAAQGRSDGQGDRQPMVLDLPISRQWRVRDRVEHAQGKGRRDGRPALPHRRRRPAAAGGRRAHGHPGRQGGEVHHHLDRRHPQLRGPRLLDQARRQPRQTQRDLGQGRARRRLFRPMLRAVRRAPRLHADRGRSGVAGQICRMGRVEGRHDARSEASRQRPTAPALRP